MKKLLTPVAWIVVMVVIMLILGVPSAVYFNYLSIFVIVLIVIPLLFAFGMFENFMYGFKIAFSRNNEYTSRKIQSSVIAVELSIKLVIISGLIACFVGTIAALGTLGELSRLGPYVSFSLCSILYSLFILIFLYPLNARLKTMLAK